MLASTNVKYSKTVVYLHDLLTVHAQISTPHHLQINRRQRQRPPLTRGLLVHLDDFGLFSSQTSFEQDRHCSSIEEMHSSPEKVDFDVISGVHDFYAPEFLGFEVLYS